MRVLGIDTSLAGTGMYYLAEEPETRLIKTSPKNTTEQRINYIAEMIMSDYYRLEPNLVVIEGPFMHLKHATSTISIVGLNIHIRCLLTKANARFEVVAPTVLKKFATGSGSAKKDMMSLSAKNNFGITFTDDNICDAFWLARWGLNHYGKV